MEGNLQNPLNEQIQQQQQQQQIINENEEQVQQQLIINADQEQVQQQQQQQQFNEDQEHDFDNFYGEQSDDDLDNYAEQRSSEEEEEEDNVSKRIYVLDEIDPHPLRCNLCPASTFTYPKGVKEHRKDKHGLYKFECHCGFLYFTDQDRERHISDRHPKAPKQKKCPKKRKKAR